jgi:hypothetical protein
VGALAEQVRKAEADQRGDPRPPEEERTRLQLEAIRRLLEKAGSKADPATAGELERGVLGEHSVLLRLGSATAVVGRDGGVNFK